MAFNPRQKRDRDGKWAGGPVTAVIGGRSYDPDIGVARTRRAGFERRVAQLNPENAPFRAERSYAQGQRAQRGTVQRASGLRQRALAGDRSLTQQERWSVEYASPKKTAEARRVRGHLVMTQADLNERVRGRTKRSRDVTFNRLSGRFVAVRGGTVPGDASNFDRELINSSGYGGTSRRPKSSGAAARAKLAGARTRKPTPDAIQTDTGGYISREQATIAMFGPEEAARRLAKKSAKKPARGQLSKPAYVGRRRAES